MGKNWIAFYRERVKPTWKIAFFTVIVVGLLTHLYKFTNYLPDRDSLLNIYDDQDILTSGRWLLSLACGIGSYFDLPMVNGLLSLLYMGLTMVLITEVLHMENPILLILSGGLLATFPGTTETFLYEYTADGYFLAMLLAAVAAYLTRMDCATPKRAYPVAACCLCMCCGIYQAYVSFALVLSLLHLCLGLLEDRYDKKSCTAWIIRQIFLYLVSMAAYYAIWKGIMAIRGVEANDYQGISNIGTNLFKTFLSGFPASVKTVAGFFLQWNVLKFGFTPYIVLNLLFLGGAVLIIIVGSVRSGVWKRKWQAPLFAVSLMLIIPASCIWCFASQGVDYRPMMLQCLVLFYIFVLVMFDRWAGSKGANAFAILALVIIFNFGLIANISYHYLTRCYERTYAIGIQMSLDISELQKTETFDRFTVYGDGWLEDKLAVYDYENHRQTQASGIGILSQYMYNDLLYDQDRVIAFLTEYIGVDLTPVLWQDSFNQYLPQDMPNWPSEGGMTVAEGMLIIKIHD